MQVLSSEKGNSRTAILLIASFVLGLAGCGIPDAVVWFPDSTGILYSDDDGSRLVQYDVSKNARRVIVQDTQTQTPWPALRTDGKRVAVAKIEVAYTKDSESSTVRTQALIYDLDGGLLQRSKVNATTRKLAKPSDESRTEIESAGLNWSGPQSKILISDIVHSAIWDCVKDSWVNLDVQPIPFENMPVRPDGQGFMAFLEKGDEDLVRLSFVDWQGQISEFDQLSVFTDDSNPELGSEWDEEVFRLLYKDFVQEYDTSSIKASRKDKKSHFLRSEGQLAYLFHFQENGSQLCLFVVEEGEGSDSEITKWELEVQWPNRDKRKVILTDQDYSCPVPMFSFFPSPDRKKVALDLSTSSDDKRTIVVIDSDGSILATIKPD